MALEAHSDTMVDLQLGSFGELEGCTSAVPPSRSNAIPTAMAWSSDGKPTNINGSASTTWSEPTVTFLANSNTMSKAHEAATKAHDDPDGAKETITLIIKDKTGSPICTYALQNALVKDVGAPQVSAGGSGFLECTLTIHAEDVTIS